MGDTSPIAGIVVIGRDEGDRLLICLDSCAGAGLPLVYVDSSSADDSVCRARARGAMVVELDTVKPFTAARARNEGCAMLTAHFPQLAYVLFIDGDCALEPDWPDTAFAFLESNPQYAACCGRRRERAPQASPYNALADAEWDTPIGDAKACGGDAVYRINAFWQAGGFDPALIAGEEPELCGRLFAAGLRIARLDAPMSIHDAAIFRFGQWWRRAVRSGYGYAQAWRTARRTSNDPLYRRQLVRAIVWAGILPVASIVLAARVHQSLLAIWPGLTAVQYVRVAARDGEFRARLAVAGKYAELLGIARYSLHATFGIAAGSSRK